MQLILRLFTVQLFFSLYFLIVCAVFLSTFGAHGPYCGASSWQACAPSTVTVTGRVEVFFTHSPTPSSACATRTDTANNQDLSSPRRRGPSNDAKCQGCNALQKEKKFFSRGLGPRFRGDDRRGKTWVPAFAGMTVLGRITLPSATAGDRRIADRASRLWP